MRKGSGKDGFVPANYVKEIEGKRIPVQVRQPFTVKDVRRVKKMRMAKGKVPVSKPKPAPKTTGKYFLVISHYLHLFIVLHFQLRNRSRVNSPEEKEHKRFLQRVSPFDQGNKHNKLLFPYLLKYFLFHF